jgi:hypothetical protein
MRVIEDRFELAMMHLRHSWRAVQPLLDGVLDRGNSDMYSALEVKAAYRELRDRLRDLAYYQHGIGARREKRKWSRR